MLSYNFSFRKTLQAAALLLKGEPGGTMNYTKLLKLLYLADRESIRECGFPITGDMAVAMKNGPVLSLTYDLIKAEGETPEWSKHIERCSQYDVRLVSDPGDTALSDFERKTLSELRARHAGDDFAELIRIVHELPEWKKNDPGDGMRPIPIKDILEATGRSEWAERIQAQVNVLSSFDEATDDRDG